MDESSNDTSSSPIQRAIREFRDEQLDVYRRAPNRITRDANSAAETTRDHVGRWLFELIQNADDAKAVRLVIELAGGCLYVADDGVGLIPQAVESLSGTHLSIKPATSIGRKGLGFKSVYAISHSPCVFSANDGITFSPEQAKQWLSDNGFDMNEAPYQWLPFWVSRSEASTTDPTLVKLSEFHTVVKLPLFETITAAEIHAAFTSFAAYSLLMFHHLRCVEIRTEAGYTLSVGPCNERGDEWTVCDSRIQADERWRLSRLPVRPPAEILAEFDRIEDRARSAEVSLLVATPMNDADIVQQAPAELPLHVYYATNNAAPLRLLLHADFVVKSDRTEIIAPANSRFNDWLSDQLAQHIVRCVDEWHTDAEPAASLRLLNPQKLAETDNIGRHLWQRITEHAKAALRLPDVTRQRDLHCADACFVSTTAGRGLAREIFAQAECGKRLVHESLEADNDVREVLSKLDCIRLDDEKVFELISREGRELAVDHERLWLSWRWVAQWVPENRKRDYTEKGNAERRSKRLSALTILPVDGNLCSADDIGDCTLTWRTPELCVSLPDWLPLRFLDDWFRDRMGSTAAEDPLWQLQNSMEIKHPKKHVVADALARAIESYWRDETDDPGRIHRLIRDLNLHEKGVRPKEFGACPVLVRIEGGGESEWARADLSYFGREWGNSLLDEFFRGMPGIAWLHRPSIEADAEHYAAIFEWLGVVEYPRLVQRSSLTPAEAESERSRILRALKDCTRIEELPQSVVLHHTASERLDTSRSVLLIRLLARHWAYYKQHRQVSVRYFYRSSRCDHVDARWWIELREVVTLPQIGNYAKPAVLKDFWLPERDTARTVGELLPTIDLGAFGEDQEIVGKWLRDEVRVRARVSEITLDEWRDLLEKRIPEVIPETAIADDTLRDKVHRWHESALDSLRERDDSPRVLAAKLLCSNGGQWAYKPTREAMLADDAELSQAFRTSCWQIEFIQRLHGAAGKIFGLRSLKEKATITTYKAVSRAEAPALQERLDGVKAFAFVWRCSRTREDHETLCEKLWRLRVNVANQIEADAKLGAVEKTIERQVALIDGQIVIKRGGDELSLLAQGLAQAVGSGIDANFFEILMRCEGDAERERRLRSNDCSSEEVRRLLQEYMRDFERPSPPVMIPPVDTGGTPLPPGPSDPKPAPSVLDTDRQPDPPPVQDTPPKTPIRLKDVNVERPTVAWGQAAVLPDKPDGGGGGSGGEGWPLSDDERADIEKCGRDFAAQWLETNGYQVEQMPQFNAGFDMRAIKEGECLLIELKAHSHTAKIVDLTASELREHERCNRTGSSGKRWELWNVENLAADATAEIRITRYDSIADDAFKARILSLDLRLCSSLSANSD